MHKEQSSHLPFIHIHRASDNYAENMKNAFVLLKSCVCLCSCVYWCCCNKGIPHYYNISCFSTCLLQSAYAEWVKTCMQVCLRALILETLRCFGTQGESWKYVGLDVTPVNSAISTRKTGPVHHLGCCVFVVTYIFFLYSVWLVSPFSHLGQILSASFLSSVRPERQWPSPDADEGEQWWAMNRGKFSCIVNNLNEDSRNRFL